MLTLSFYRELLGLSSLFWVMILSFGRCIDYKFVTSCWRYRSRELLGLSSIFWDMMLSFGLSYEAHLSNSAFRKYFCNLLFNFAFLISTSMCIWQSKSYYCDYLCNDSFLISLLSPDLLNEMYNSVCFSLFHKCFTYKCSERQVQMKFWLLCIDLLWHFCNRGKGDYQMEYVPAPRITETDKTNDRK